MLKSKFLWFVIILTIAGYFVVPKFLGGAPMGMMPGGPMPAMVAKVIKKDITLWDEFSGRLQAVDSVQIRPRVSGQIESVHFKDGQNVKKGDILFVIDPRPYRAELLAAKARYVRAEAEYNRATLLLAEKAISQKDYDQRKNDMTVAKSALTQAQLNLGYTRVKSPIDGKVGRREMSPGHLVNVGEPVLTTVVSQHPIYADFEADEQRFIKYIAANEESSVDLNSLPVMLEVSGAKGPRKGRVQSFDNQLDVNSGTIRVRTEFDNEDGTLVPGMFVRVRITSGDSGPALLVADSAIGTDQDKKFVYVVDAENTATYREVSLGPAHGRLRVIRSGLEEGESIIAKGILRIRPGMKVQPNLTTMEEVVAPPKQDTTTEQPEEHAS